MINTIEVTEAIEVQQFLIDLLHEGFSVSINRMPNTGGFIVSVDKQIAVDDCIIEDFKSITLHGAILQAWQKFS